MTNKNIAFPVNVKGVWAFPPAPAIRFATSAKVNWKLPGYVTYSEFQKAMGENVVETPLPSREKVLAVTRQITSGGDFLFRAWMREVRSAWAKSLIPRFAFSSESRNECYWWCDVISAKGWDAHTYIILAVDSRDHLARYAFYTERSAEEHEYLIRFHDKIGRETEVRYKTTRGLIAGIRKMSRDDDHFIFSEKRHDEFLQAVRVRDGSLYVEYQLYHMTWQMRCRKMSYDDVISLVRKYNSGGAAAIANEVEWECCPHPDRKSCDLGLWFKERLHEASRKGREPVVKTILALERAGLDFGRLRVPMFVRKDGVPTRWLQTLHYLSKHTPKKIMAAVKVSSAIGKEACAYRWYDVAELFFYGRGVARDYQLAMYWASRAKKMGTANAASLVARLKNYLDPNRLEKSAGLRSDYVREVKGVIQGVIDGGASIGLAWDQLYNIECACECDMHDGKLVSRDYSAAEKCWQRAMKRLDEMQNEIQS